MNYSPLDPCQAAFIKKHEPIIECLEVSPEMKRLMDIRTRIEKDIAKALAVPKHMLSKRGIPSFMEMIDPEEVFPLVEDKDNEKR